MKLFAGVLPRHVKGERGEVRKIERKEESERVRDRQKKYWEMVE